MEDSRLSKYRAGASLPQWFAKLLFLIQVSRPIIWPVLPLVYALGLNASHAPLSAAAIIQVVLLTFPMNLVGCGLNDIYDYESDRRSSRRRAVWGAVVRNEDRPLVFRAALFMMPLIVLGACFTRNWDNIVATVSLLLVAWLYSVPPMRLKERPPLDSLANGLGYFLLPFTMGYSLNADPREMPLKYYLLALCVCGVHALGNGGRLRSRSSGRASNDGRCSLAGVRRLPIAFAAFLTDVRVRGLSRVRPSAFMLRSVPIATLIAALVPRDRVIAAACVIVFAGFLIAAVSSSGRNIVACCFSRKQRSPNESGDKFVGIVPRIGAQKPHFAHAANRRMAAAARPFGCRRACRRTARPTTPSDAGGSLRSAVDSSGAPTIALKYSRPQTWRH